MNQNNGKELKRRYRYTSDYFRQKKKLLHRCVAVNKTQSETELQKQQQPETECITQVVSTESTTDDPQYESLSMNTEEVPGAGGDDDDGDDEEEDGTAIEEEIDFMNDLSSWALENKLTHRSVTTLLKILRKHGRTELPRDSRTLLKTPRDLTIINIGCGQMWYHGIQNNLLNALWDIDNDITVSLKFNIDGMSPFSSSSLELWPILFVIDNMDNIKPMAVSVYYGHGKPPLKEFLTPFVDELSKLLENGVIINRHKVNVIVKCFICDTPARCFIKGK